MAAQEMQRYCIIDMWTLRVGIIFSNSKVAPFRIEQIVISLQRGYNKIEFTTESSSPSLSLALRVSFAMMRQVYSRSIRDGFVIALVMLALIFFSN